MISFLRGGKGNADFFDWFEGAAATNVEAAKLLKRLCADFSDAETMAQRLHDLEHHGDELSHRIYNQLNQVFMPPMDREDIIALARALDDVNDFIHAAGDAISVYNVPKPTDVMQALAQVIVTSTEEVARQLPNLRKRRTRALINEGIIEINRLENQADDLLRRGLWSLFHENRDPIEVLTLSKIYETMERVTDKCEDIADVLRGLIIKHG